MVNHFKIKKLYCQFHRPRLAPAQIKLYSWPSLLPRHLKDNILKKIGQIGIF